MVLVFLSFFISLCLYHFTIIEGPGPEVSKDYEFPSWEAVHADGLGELAAFVYSLFCLLVA